MQQRIASAVTSDQATMAVQLLDKLRKGEETYYLAGQTTVDLLLLRAPSLTLGGFIQTPFGPGYVPDALHSTLSWLRMADTMEPAGVNGSMWKVVRTWMGGPNGHGTLNFTRHHQSYGDYAAFRTRYTFPAARIAAVLGITSKGVRKRMGAALQEPQATCGDPSQRAWKLKVLQKTGRKKSRWFPRGKAIGPQMIS